mgnify:CR=1 FL=1
MKQVYEGSFVVYRARATSSRQRGAMVSEDENLNTTITDTNGATFVQGDDYNLEVSFRIEGWNELTENYPNEKHLIRAMVFNNDDELIYQDDDIPLADEGTVTWNGRYTNEDGEEIEIDAANAPYRFVVTAFCGKDPQEIEEELDCAILGPTACYLKKLLEGKETAVELMKSLYSDSVLVVESHDAIEIEYEERNLAERLLNQIKEANINHTTKIDITGFYEKAPDPSYKMTANINDKNIPLFIIHQLSDKDHKIYPLKENASGPHELVDGTYNHKLEFDGDDNIFLELRTKNEEDMEGLVEYLFGPDLELIQEKADSALDIGEAWNPNSEACNNVVRAYIYCLKQDPVLFPVEMEPGHRFGSGLEGPDGPTILKGEISWDGTANKIYKNLEDGDLSEYFSEITKSSTQTWNDFFNDMQDKANSGEIIIGVKKEISESGHIVTFMPESLYTGSAKIIDFINTNEDDIVFPIALEGGGNIKEIKPFIGSENELTRNINPYIFYKYKK